MVSCWDVGSGANSDTFHRTRSQNQWSLLLWIFDEKESSSRRQRIFRLLHIPTGHCTGSQSPRDSWSARKGNSDFISPTLWSPNSPELNLMDYKIYSVMQETVHRQNIRDIDKLQECIVELWNHLDHSVIDSAIRQWRTIRQACVRQKGRHLSTSYDIWQ